MNEISPRVRDLRGQKFGRLSILSFVGINDNRKALWKCKCECGNEMIVTGNRLLTSNTKSCGCYNKEVISLPIGIASKNKVYGAYKRNAGRRGVEFSLSKEELYRLMSLNCFYCGRPPSNFYRLQNGNGGTIYSGIDRIDSGKGYTESNCVPCCAKCNYAKRLMSYDEFKDWIFTVADHMISKEISYATIGLSN